jgi:hypothetical protein
MLIAIMSETLSKNNARGKESTYKEHLKFIVHNWHLLPKRQQYYKRLDRKLYLNQDNDYEETFVTDPFTKRCSARFYKFICCSDEKKSKSNGRVNYLVTAFLHEEDEEQVEILKELQEDVNTMRATSSQDLEDILIQVKNIRNHIREHQQQFYGN